MTRPSWSSASGLTNAASSSSDRTCVARAEGAAKRVKSRSRYRLMTPVCSPLYQSSSSLPWSSSRLFLVGAATGTLLGSVSTSAPHWRHHGHPRNDGRYLADDAAVSPSTPKPKRYPLVCDVRPDFGPDGNARRTWMSQKQGYSEQRRGSRGLLMQRCRRSPARAGPVRRSDLGGRRSPATSALALAFTRIAKRVARSDPTRAQAGRASSRPTEKQTAPAPDGRARNWGKSDHAGSASTTNSLSLSLANVTKRSPK